MDEPSLLLIWHGKCLSNPAGSYIHSDSGVAEECEDLPTMLCATRRQFEEIVMLGTILLVLLVLMLFGSLPTWPHSRSWGYYPTGGLGLIVIVLLILLLMGRI
jgi:hypothetical protein